MVRKKTRAISFFYFLVGCVFFYSGADAAAQQNGVTLYGIIDLGIQYDRASQNALPGPLATNALNQSFFGMSNGVQSGSRWGLRGRETLAAGIAVDFVLESGFNPAQGTSSQGGRLFGRQSTMGISLRDVGRLDIGRQINLASNYFLTIDPFAEGFGQANIGTSFGSANTTRLSNMLLLQATPLTGLTVGAGYSFATGLTGIYAGSQYCLVTQSCPESAEGYNFNPNQNMRALTLGAQYKRGPLDLALAYDIFYGEASKQEGNVGPSSWLIGGAYDFNVLKLSLALGRSMNGFINGQSSGTGAAGPSGLVTPSGTAGGVLFLPGAQSSSYMVGLTVPLSSQTTVLASWQMLQPQGLLAGDPLFQAQQIYSAALTQQLSPRTNIYTFVSYAQNYAMVSSAESFVLGLGIRHQF